MKSIYFLGVTLALATIPATARTIDQIDLGNNDSEFSRDGECDDPRFVGDGMAEALLTDSIGRDAADCRSALDAGSISLNPWYAEPASPSTISYGDNSSEYANDGECDDIRFAGDYSATMIFLVEDIGHDANDCRAAVKSGAARWQGATATPVRGMDVSEFM